MQNMHKSMYLHILHIYALPTLLMTVQSLERTAGVVSTEGERNLKHSLAAGACRTDASVQSDGHHYRTVA